MPQLCAIARSARDGSGICSSRARGAKNSADDSGRSRRSPGSGFAGPRTARGLFRPRRLLALPARARDRRHHHQQQMAFAYPTRQPERSMTWRVKGLGPCADPRKSGSHQTPCWREMDSNPRSPVRRTTLFETPLPNMRAPPPPSKTLAAPSSSCFFQL